MEPLNNGYLRYLMRLTVVLGLLGILVLLSLPKTNWNFTYNFKYSWLEYTDDDGGPETACDCSGILQGEREALDEAKLRMMDKDFRKSIQIPDEYYINATKDCRNFLLSRKYLTFPLSQEEEDFPLAYSMVVHHKVQNFERLLRAIYAPQNIYCVHLDRKSDTSIFAAIMGITSCFPNVFMVSKPVSVVYAAWSRVQADLNCMADLYNASTKWKYFINLCGQDFPLKTNLEMVRVLRSLKGGNSVESRLLPWTQQRRVSHVYEIVDGHIQATERAKDPPPLNLTIMHGSAYIIVNRGYIRSVLKDKRIQELIEWGKDTYSPDEFLWATIQRMHGVPGSIWPHPKYDTTDMTAFVRLVKWYEEEGSQGSLEVAYPLCQGYHLRSICVYGVGDLQWLLKQQHFFANKFDTDTDHFAVYCLEKYLRQKALAELH